MISGSKADGSDKYMDYEDVVRGGQVKDSGGSPDGAQNRIVESPMCCYAYGLVFGTAGSTADDR
jgi:hypothetical protein